MPPDEAPVFTKEQVDEIVGNRLREQSERSWSDRVNGGIAQLAEQQKRLADSFSGLTDTNRDIHGVLTRLLDWQAQQVQAQKEFRSDAMTPEMRGVFFDMARTFLWAKSGWKVVVGVWGLVVIFVAPLVSHAIDAVLHLQGK